MPFEDKSYGAPAPHHVVLEDRQHLTVSGVEDVESFDENAIVLRANLGLLTIRGANLHIEKLSLDGGDLRVEGTVDSLVYSEAVREGGSLFSRLFR